MMRMVLIVLTLTLVGCSNVERIENNPAQVYDQQSISQVESTIIPEPIEDNTTPSNSSTPFEAGDESIYPFGDKRLRKHKDYPNSVLIEEKNKWDAQLLRIVQDVEVWTLLGEDYRVSTGLVVGKLDGSVIVYECNYVEEEVIEVNIETVKRTQMESVKDVMKKLAYKLNKLN